jgi:glycolate oxidase FAD binding subunit
MKGEVVRPVTEAEVSECVREARGALCIRGGGTRGMLVTGDVLETSGLAGVRLYEPGALTLVVGAGTPVAEVDRVLAAEGQRLAFEVPDLRGVLGRSGVSTIGGVVAANASGPRRVQVGGARDSLLGVRFVDGRGVVVQNGGRVMKNVTGYDLVKLLAGSHGALGVLTEVSLKLQAVPEAEATLVVQGGGAAVLARALGSPYDVSGAAWDGRALVRVEGMAGSVAYRAQALRGMLGGDVVTGAESAAIWAGIRDVAALQGLPGALWRVSVKPTHGPELLARLGMDHRALLDWGGGLVWLLVDDAGDAGAGVIRGLVAQMGGHATLMRGPADVPAFMPEAAGVAALTQALRAKFDPKGILNAGLMAHV